MSSPLDKFPTGLLELFRLKTLGDAPRRFGDTVQPSIDVADLYGVDVLKVLNSSLSGVAITQTIVQTFGTTWRGPTRVVHASAFVQVGAAPGTQIRMLIGVRPNPIDATNYIGEHVVEAPKAGGYYAVVSQAPIVVLPVGGQFIFEIQGDAAGGDHIVASRALCQVLADNA